MTLKHVENKHIEVLIKAEDEEEHDTVVKVKFYKHGDENLKQLLVNFSRKSGDIMKWYKLLEKMKEINLNYLLSPNIQNIDTNV